MEVDDGEHVMVVRGVYSTLAVVDGVNVGADVGHTVCVGVVLCVMELEMEEVMVAEDVGFDVRVVVRVVVVSGVNVSVFWVVLLDDREQVRLVVVLLVGVREGLPDTVSVVLVETVGVAEVAVGVNVHVVVDVIELETEEVFVTRAL